MATDPEARRGGAGDRIASIAADRPRIAEALGHFAWGTRQYLLVTTVFGLIVAVLDTIALAILGIPLAITWGLLSFITNYIPNIGFILGVIPPALLGLLTGGPKLMVIVIVVYCVLNTVIQSVIQPRFIGDAVGLSVTVTFVVLFFWSWLLGQPGERDQLQTHVVERLPSTAGNARITRSLRHPRGSREATVYCLRTWSPCRQPIRSASAASCCGAGSASAAWAGCLSGRLRRASRRLSRSSGRSSPTIRSSGNGSVARSRPRRR